MKEPLPYNPREVFGANVKHWRTERNLNGQGLADKVTQNGFEGFSSKASISDVENGKKKVGIDGLFALAQALNVSPLALIAPTKDVTIAGKVRSPEQFTMWWRMIVPLPIESDTKQDLVAHDKQFLQSLPVRETTAFNNFEGLRKAWVALANIIANLADDDIDGARLRTFSLIENLSQVFNLIVKAQKEHGTIVVQSMGSTNYAKAEWQRLRDERDNLLEQLVVNNQEVRRIEEHMLGKKEQE